MRSGMGIYAAAAVVGAIESAIPGGPTFSAWPGVIGLAMIPLIAVVGPRVPRSAMVVLGPFGAALIALAVATTVGYSDAAILYSWPVLWVAYFYGRRATVFVVLSIGVLHALALVSMPGGEANVDRWFDVMVSATMIGAVVSALAARNRRLVTELTAEARVDHLTGLLNRRGLDERFEAELARGERDGTAIALVAIDVDRFKTINDGFGHEVGDRVLTWIARTMDSQTRASDLTARLGGDEFLVVLPDTGADAAREFANRLRLAIGVGSRQLPEGLVVTISAGVDTGSSELSAQTLSDTADQALYAAKARGRNTLTTVDLTREALDLSPPN